MSRRLANDRIRLLLGLFACAFALALVRAVWLQGVRAQALGSLAAKQQHETVAIPAHRGTIYDRTGVPLALGEQATTVYANPRQVRNPRAVAVASARTLGLKASDVYPLLADRSRGFAYVERQADPERAAALERRGLAGLGFYPEERRSYPQRSVAAQVVGYAGVDNHGLAGLELGLDRELSGRVGEETIVKDALGRPIDVKNTIPEREGRNVYLTLDHNIQTNAEAVLADTVHRWHAHNGTAIVLDPRTGGILAMAVSPGYDANKYPRVWRPLQRNRTVTDTYEPGSTFKLVTVAAALSDRIVSPLTAFTLPYSIHVSDRVVHDAEPRGTERLTVGQILSHSSNVGAITLAELLGKDRLTRWISRFGFGHETGIDFPGESAGIVLPSDRWSGSTIGNVPIGQGIAVTPVQMAAAYAAIANHGTWIQPHLVSRVAERSARRLARRRILTRETAAELMSMLRNVVSEGTGTLAAVPGYQVAGKTGTAQKPDAHGQYSETKYVASFVGMVPASAPRLVILVTIDEPQGAIFGGVVAAPAFQRIASFDLQYLGVPPDDPSSLGTASAGAAQSVAGVPAATVGTVSASTGG